MKFFSAAQSINARNVRVSCGVRNITLAIIFRVSLAFFRFRLIITEAHIIGPSIFLPLFSLICRIWQYNRARHNYNKGPFCNPS